MDTWNPWHGCHMLSPGCQNCYVYRRDRSGGRDAGQVRKTADFDLPLRRGRDGEYKLRGGREIFACGTSDFFLEDADPWRAQAWRCIAARPDLHFLIITKRIDRFSVLLPDDWGQGYDNVTIGCTCENQDRADYRLPIFRSLPIRHRSIIAAPLLDFHGAPLGAISVSLPTARLSAEREIFFSNAVCSCARAISGLLGRTD